MTALGAALVSLTKEVKRRVLDALLGFAEGVMIAASYFSLLAPAVEFAEAAGSPRGYRWWSCSWAGDILLGIDRVLSHCVPVARCRRQRG
jgi:ZIP family zinc transporter